MIKIYESSARNGSLRDFKPEDLMRKVAETGYSMNTEREFGDDVYTIFVSYEDFIGPKGIDDMENTKYNIDIIKEDKDGKQDRVFYKGKLLYDDVITTLDMWLNNFALL